MIENLHKSILDNLNDGVVFYDSSGKITYWNKGSEIISGYKVAEAVGHTLGRDISFHHLDNLLQSKGDAELFQSVMSNGEISEEKAFLKHKDGYLVPVILCLSPIKDGSGNITGAVEIINDNSWKIAALERIEELNKMTLLDSLTLIGNRRHAEITLRSRLEELRRYGLSFGLIFVDIDDFKFVNDAFGHQYGDRILHIVVKSLLNGLRVFDTVSRWGGDEFVIFVTNIHDEEQMRVLVQRLSSLVNSSSLTIGGDSITPSVSIGATIAIPSDSTESIIQRVDRLMYQSKELGKNRITLG